MKRWLVFRTEEDYSGDPKMFLIGVRRARVDAEAFAKAYRSDHPGVVVAVVNAYVWD